jgi:single-stranded-DNA-specific exonuclease
VPTEWIIAPPEDLRGAAIKWEELCGSPCIARLLSRMNFGSRDEVELFLRPRLKSLADPFLLPQMDRAVARLLRAIETGERVVLFGDYDVDGVTSLALLSSLLSAYGLTPALFLPLRMEEGYGLTSESVERCLASHQPQLLVAVDCGTSSVAEIKSLGERGVDVIVLDHHEPRSALPECVAIVNPKTIRDSPFHYFCSAGIVFKLCHALLKTRPLANFDLRSHLDLVALGTVADIVPLHRENRTLVQRGAREIERSSRPGLRKLMEVSGVRAPVLPEHIGFRLGPRLNAAGRLSTAEKALRLLVTDDLAEAAALANDLDRENRDRQEVERQILIAAEKQVASDFDSEKDAAIVVGARGWHPGVLGIVASRLSKKHHRPTIVVGFDDHGAGKGSGRSIEGLSLVQALTQCADLLEKFGGHEMAAGISIAEEKFEAFKEAFKKAARDMLSDEQLRPRLRIDHELTFSEINFDLLRWHELLQPFGNGNPQPLFCSRGVESAAPPRKMKDKHLLLKLRQGNYHQRAVYFDAVSLELPPPPWDVAYRIKAGEYEGESRLDLHVHSIRPATVPN